jgi:hypothetical protein
MRPSDWNMVLLIFKGKLLSAGNSPDEDIKF